MSRLALILIFGSLAFGQLGSNSVTVTATRSTTLQPDQATFSVSVSSSLQTAFSDVLTALQPAGITIANLTGVGSNTNYGPLGQATTTVQWTFSLVAPLTGTSGTVAMLTALETSVAQANPNLTVSFAINGTQVSTQLQQSQTCPHRRPDFRRDRPGAGVGIRGRTQLERDSGAWRRHSSRRLPQLLADGEVCAVR